MKSVRSSLILSLVIAFLFSSSAFAYNTPVSGTVPVSNGGTGATTAQGAATNLGLAAALKQIFEQLLAGDSYLSGYGATNDFTTSLAGLAAQDTPAPQINVAVGGTTAATIVNSVFTSFNGGNPSKPSVMIINGGENDGTTCSGAPSSQCGISFGNLYRAADAWFSIPAANKILASNAAQTGTWTTPSGVFPAVTDIYQPTLTASQGTALQSSVNASTLTFNLPSSASAKVGVIYRVVASQTGTFTVSVDGTLRIDDCSATTTFSSAPCGTNPTITSPGSFYLQEFTVTSGQTHQVVITNTSPNNMEIVAVDWLPAANASGVNAVFQIGVNAAWGNYLNWNAVTLPLVTSLQADGLPIFYVDPVNGVPGLNATTDLSTSATTLCPASTYAMHPNDCGYLHLWQTVVSTEAANNWVFSQSNAGGKVAAFSGTLPAAFAINNNNIGSPNSLTASHAQTFSSFGNNLPGGIDVFRNASNQAGLGVYIDGSTGKPWSGQYVDSMFQTNGTFWNCNSSYSLNGTSSNSFSTRSCFDPYGNLYAPTINTPANAAFALTSSGYTVPANLGLVRFNQAATLASATISLPTETTDGVGITFDNYIGAITALTFSPAVNGWTNGATMAAASVVRVRWDNFSSTWQREQ